MILKRRRKRSAPDGDKTMLSKFLVTLGIIGVSILLAIFSFAICSVSKLSQYERESDDLEQIEYLKKYQEEKELKNASRKMSKMRR